jgi:hypothetical protein
VLSWSNTGYKLTLGVGSLVIAGMLSELWQDVLPAWAGVGIALLPVVLFVFVHPGELPARVVWVAHVLAAIWYLALAVGLAVLLAASKPLPRGWPVALLFLAMGAIPCGTVLYQVARGRYQSPEGSEKSHAERDVVLDRPHNAEHSDRQSPMVDPPSKRGIPKVESEFRVIINTEEVACEHPKRGREAIRWTEVVRVSYVTTSQGPWLPDEWLLFEGKVGGCSVPTEAQGFEKIWDELKVRFPGFDYRPMLEGGTDDAGYLCWTKPAEQGAAADRPRGVATH